MILNQITRWRLAEGVSKAHLARRIGVDRSYITKLEQGKIQPSGEMMFRLSEYLGQPIAILFQHEPALKRANAFSGLKCCLKGN